MSEYSFGLHKGHLSEEADKIARKIHPQAGHVNYKEPNGEKRGWFFGPNRGHPFDDQLAREVLAAVAAAGGCIEDDSNVPIEVHVTAVRRGSIYGHQTKYCNAAGCSGYDQYWGELNADEDICAGDIIVREEGQI